MLIYLFFKAGFVTGTRAQWLGCLTSGTHGSASLHLPHTASFLSAEVRTQVFMCNYDITGCELEKTPFFFLLLYYNGSFLCTLVPVTGMVSSTRSPKAERLQTRVSEEQHPSSFFVRPCLVWHEVQVPKNKNKKPSPCLAWI